MAGANAPYTRLDYSQVLQQAFDEATDRLRVDAQVTASISDIKLTDGTKSATFTTIGSHTAVDVNVLNGLSLFITDTEDSIKIGNGSGNFLAINTDGSLKNRLYDSSGNSITSSSGALNVNVGSGSVTVQPGTGSFDMVETGIVSTAYNEITNVSGSNLTTITTYTATQPSRIKLIEVSGTNVAAYTVYLNGTPIHKKRTYYANLDNSFNFSKGYPINTSDVVSVRVLHTQASSGDFNAFILILKD